MTVTESGGYGLSSYRGYPSLCKINAGGCEQLIISTIVETMPPQTEHVVKPGVSRLEDGRSDTEDQGIADWSSRACP